MFVHRCIVMRKDYQWTQIRGRLATLCPAFPAMMVQQGKLVPYLSPR